MTLLTTVETTSGTRTTGTWRLPVLMYHSVAHASVATALPGSVSRERLAEQLTALVDAGHELVGLTEALALVDRRPDRRVVAVTVDDGLLDALNAVSVLRDLGARATFYVPTAPVGVRTSRWSAEPSRLGWAQLEGMAAAGMEIGSHTVHHRPLDVHSAATVRAEVRDSKHVLEDRLGRAIKSFCYPHGYTSARVTAEVAAAGYTSGCVIGRRVGAATDDRLAIPRLEVRPDTTGAAIRELVTHGERGPGPLAKRIAHPAWRLARAALFTTTGLELT